MTGKKSAVDEVSMRIELYHAAHMLAQLVDELDKWDDYEAEEPEIWAFIKRYAPERLP